MFGQLTLAQEFILYSNYYYTRWPSDDDFRPNGIIYKRQENNSNKYFVLCVSTEHSISESRLCVNMILASSVTSNIYIERKRSIILDYPKLLGRSLIAAAAYGKNNIFGIKCP